MHFCSELILGTVVVAALGGQAARAESDSANVPAPRAVSVVKVDARTGRLVRTVVVKNAPVSKDGSQKSSDGIRLLVEQAAKNHDVSPLLVDSVIQVESNYNPYAVSPKGAQGLMQLMPDTARRFGVTDSFDAEQNIEAGVKYLKFLQDTFKDDRLAIAAYNAGEKAVAKYGDVPPYAETTTYVAKVGDKYAKAKQAAEKSGMKANGAEDQAPAQEELRHVVQYQDSAGRLHLATQ